MKPFQSSFGSKIQINFKLLGASIFGVSAWALWPSNPEWWGLGVVAIILGLGAVGLLVEALRAMAKLYSRDKAMAEFLAQGNKPKSSALVSDELLDELRLTDD